MGVVAKTFAEYPPLDSLFDAAHIKGLATRRVFSPVASWRPRVHGTPYDAHQDWMLGCFLRFPRFLAFADTGLGKTKCALDAIDYHFTQRQLKHALVLTSTAPATYEWTEQAAHYIQTEVRDVQGSPAQRREALMHYPTAPIIATDYSTLQTAFAPRVKLKRKLKHVADLDALYHFGRMFDIVVLDEVHRMKSESSLRHQMVRALIRDIPVRYGLTGTPFDRHPEDAWAQYYLIDDGETFGTQAEFLQTFFKAERSYWSIYHQEYRLKKEMKEDFRRRVRNRGIRITSKECKNLPEVRRVRILVPPAPGAVPHFKKAQERIRDARQREVQHTEFQFLRQLCSGLLRVRNDEVDTTLRMEPCPKILWLLSHLESLPTTEQIVVFYEFTESGRWLDEELRKHKYKVSWLRGGMAPGLDTEVLAQWKQKKSQVLLTQTEKACESLNLQQAMYLVQYESPLTYRQEKQSLARVGGRIGGRSSVVYTIMVRGSKEQRILDLIREGKAISQELLEAEEDGQTTQLPAKVGQTPPFVPRTVLRRLPSRGHG